VDDSLEVITSSIATAGVLVTMGHEPRRIFKRDGKPVFVFAPEAEGVLRKFRLAKQQLDRVLESA
jgi:hypothetical protein